MENQPIKKCVRAIPKRPFSEIYLDFKNGSVKIYMAYPTPEEVKRNTTVEDTERKRCLILCKKFKTLESYKRVIIDDKDIYTIPEFYNKEMLAINDEKTWEMVFISVFQDEITKAAREAVEYIKTAPEYYNCQKREEIDY